MMLRVDGVSISPAVIEGAPNFAFQGSSFLLRKPKWVSDEDAGNCAICRSRFNQLRRRHHCRCCGKVFCNKCCTEKVPLPQYSLESPERVCSACVPVASCVTMSHSHDQAFHLRAVTGLSALCRDAPGSVVALGGVHAMIYLLKKKSASQLQTVAHIANGLHSLSRHESLSIWLSEIGAVQAIAHILNLGIEGTQSDMSVITDALGALRIFAKTSDKLKILAFNSGCFAPLLTWCNHKDPSISLIATSTLCLLAECPANHSSFMQHQDALRSMLKKAAESKDEQITEHVLRIVVVLSTGDDDVKHVVASEDASCGGVLSVLLQSRPNNQQIVASAASVIANLATNERDQVLLQSSLRGVLTEMPSSHPQYVTVQLVRAVANFSAHPGHAGTMLMHLEKIIRFLNVTGSRINYHAVRCIFNLLRFRTKDTVAILCRNGVADFLTRFMEMSEVVNVVISSLDKAAPSIAS